MDIKQLGHLLSLEIIQNQRIIREQQLGIRPFNPNQITDNDISNQIRTIIIVPIVKELCATTEQNITAQPGTSTGFYYLLANNRKFAILYLPNPDTGKVFMKRLNRNGKQCALSEQVNNTSQIADYLQVFSESCNP